MHALVRNHIQHEGEALYTPDCPAWGVLTITISMHGISLLIMKTVHTKFKSFDTLRCSNLCAIILPNTYNLRHILMLY